MKERYQHVTLDKHYTLQESTPVVVGKVIIEHNRINNTFTQY